MCKISKMPYITAKALKKKFRNMTLCHECGHLDEFQACSYSGNELDEHGLKKIVSICCGCGSTDIVRNPTIELAQVWYSEKTKVGTPWPEGVRRALLREELERTWNEGQPETQT